MAIIVANDKNAVAVVLKRNRRHFADIFQHTNATNGRGWQNRAAAAGCLTFIVERHIARHDRIIKRTAGVAHALKATHDLRHDFGALRVGKVQAVGNRKRRCADCANVAIGFGHGLFAAFIRVSIAITRCAICAHRQRAVGPVNTHNRCIAARKLRGVAADLGIILLPNPCARREVGAGHQLEQIRTDVRAGWNIAQRLYIGPCLILCLRRGGPVV